MNSQQEPLASKSARESSTELSPITFPVAPLAFFTLSCFALAVLLGWFVAGSGATNSFDAALSTWVQSLRTPWLDGAMLLATYLCSWPVILAGAALTTVYWALQRLWLWIVALALSLGGNDLVNWLVKQIVLRPRPDQSKALLPASGPSFPSGHTFSAFALYGLLGIFVLTLLRSKRQRSLILLAVATFAAMVGFSRIYVGAHWPTDVLGSYLLGTGWLSLIAMVLPWLQLRAPSPQQNLRPAVLVFLLWLVFLAVNAFFHPITQNAGALGEAAGRQSLT